MTNKENCEHLGKYTRECEGCDDFNGKCHPEVAWSTNKPKKEIVILLSGGIDSSTLAYYMKHQRYDVTALTLNYGQRHVKELESAKKICESLNIFQKVVDISSIQSLLAKGALTGTERIPDKDYSTETQKLTVVPNRNAILLSLAMGYAVTLDIDEVGYAAHSNDFAVYPDCRRVFVDALQKAMQLANDNPRIRIRAPFIAMSKAQVVRLGLRLKVPYRLTLSCYKGEEKACGVCGTCRERINAFKLNGVEDPIEYECEIKW